VILTRKGDFRTRLTDHAVMGRGDRTIGGSTLSTGREQGVPGPGRVVDEESMPAGIREMARGWGGDSEPHEDEERLAALRRGRLKA